MGLKSLDDGGVETWASDVKKCLLQNGFGVVWVLQQVKKIACLLQELKQLDYSAQD